MMLRELGSLSDSVQFRDHLITKLDLDLNEETRRDLTKFCQRFSSKVHGKWTQCNRTLAEFLKKQANWLESPISWPENFPFGNQQEPQEQTTAEISQCSDLDLSDNTENIPPAWTSTPSTSTGSVPRKPFEELGPRQKRRRVKQMSESHSSEELSLVSSRSLQSSGNEDVSKIMNHLLNHPEDVKKVMDSIAGNKSTKIMYSVEKALALIVSLKLSKFQYTNLKLMASEQGCDLYPSYHKIKQAKMQCYPAKEDITITEDCARIRLQALLDLTTKKLIKAIDIGTEANYKLVSKWGFDGASSQSNYKQKTTNEFDDSSVFMASLVPIRLLHGDDVIWVNETPSSTCFCRPIMFKFMQETLLTVKAEKKNN